MPFVFVKSEKKNHCPTKKPLHLHQSIDTKIHFIKFESAHIRINENKFHVENAKCF